MFWIFVHLLGAAAWFSFAAGFLTADPVVATAAFIFLGINGILGAIKTAVDQ